MKRAYWLEEDHLKEGRVDEFFPFLEETGHVIALVGAGGKSTLLYELAEQFCRRGKKTAVTTTTHIFRPDHCVCCQSLQECRSCWDRQEYAVWGTDCENGKLDALSEEEFQELLAGADVVLVEADGAKRMACKVPAAHEPVIPGEADIVIGVMGLDVLGQPLEKVCFRAQEACRLLCCEPEHILAAEDLVRILQSDQGTRKHVGERSYYVVLNKCEDPKRQRQGEEILRKLSNKAVMTCFR